MEANGTALQPPQKRQPYTPPPKKEFSDVEAAHEMNGNVSTHGHVKMSTGGLEDLAICASPGDFATKVHARNRNGKSKAAATDSSDDSLAGMLRRGMVDHQLGLSLNLVLFVGLSWLLFPSLRQKMSAFFSLSYGVSRSGETMYGQGPRDMYFVISFIVLFTGIRAFMLDYVLVPLAGLWGIGRRKGRVRFAEQSYLLLYYSLYWTWGLCLFVKGTASAWPSPAPSSSPIANLLISLWTDFPKLYLPASMKIYYLSQLAFWAQQIVVIHLEEKRKDHYQMLTHHLVTVALVSTSYGYKQWRSGNAVLVCMDIVEIVFPVSHQLSILSRHVLTASHSTAGQNTKVPRLANSMRRDVRRLRSHVGRCQTCRLSDDLLEYLRTCQRLHDELRHLLTSLNNAKQLKSRASDFI